MSRQRATRLFLALLLLACGGWLLRGYVTDDTYIHLRYAENLLERGEFSFNPGLHTYGATSPLWIFGLALLLKVGFAPLTAAWLAGLLCAVGAVLLLDGFLERMTFAVYWKTAFLVVFVSDAWFLRWTWSGMETPLATLLLLATLWPLFSDRTRSRGVNREPLWVRYLAWGVAAGLAGLTRPEFLFIAPLALPFLLWFEYYRVVGGGSERYLARPHKPLLAAICGWCVVVLPWLIYAWRTFGRITPGTASAKSGAIHFAPTEWFDYLVRAVGQLAAVQGPLWAVVVILVGIVLYRNTVWDGIERRAPQRLKLGLPLLDGPDEPVEAKALAGVGPFSIWSPVALVGIAATWSVVLLGGYAIKQVWIISRYVSPLAPVLLLAMAVIAEWLMNAPRVVATGRRAGKTVIWIGVALTLTLNWGLTLTRVVPHARAFPAGLQECYVGTGEWLKRNTPPDAVIAALDIGAVGYASERTVLDLMGLVSPQVLAAARDRGFEDLVASGDWLLLGSGGADPDRPDYFVDRSEGQPRWAGRTVHGVRFELLDTCTLQGVGLREPQPWTVALYRLESTGSRTNPSGGG